MANKNSILFVLTLLLTLTLSSCIQSERNVGTGFLPDEQILKVKQAVLYPQFVNNKPDSIQAISYNALIFGNLTNEDYGTTRMGTVAQIIPSADTLDLGQDPQLINAYLQLKIDSTVFLNPSQEGIAQNVYLLRLNSKLDSIHLYNNSITLEDFDPTPISTGAPVLFGKDSIKIYLKEEFARELMALTPEESDSAALFVERIPGMGIITDAPDGTPGGRLNYLPVGGSTIVLNYTMNHEEMGVKDTDTTAYFYFGYNYCLNFFESTSGDRLGDKTPGETLYFESLGGVKPYCSAQSIKTLLNEWIETLDVDPTTTIALSRASLDFHYEVPENYDEFDYFPGSLTASYHECRADSTQYFYPLPEVQYNVNIGSRNPSLRKYACDITSYLQDMIDKPEEELTGNDDLWLMPLLISEDSYANTYYTCNPTIYRYIKLNGSTSNNPPTLNIAYTLVHE